MPHSGSRISKDPYERILEKRNWLSTETSYKFIHAAPIGSQQLNCHPADNDPGDKVGQVQESLAYAFIPIDAQLVKHNRQYDRNREC
ncbi:hypothetical protein D3C77_500190 [compost metagenome]